ncbi:zinc transporter ZupT [Acinetobacter rathckeae]|uniref:zinc transporter ZupT n=1 Tax=Acinetobacter rathckeae TaxID=2605272 RepID=UPI0018A3264E|nr:zinc transporter ZupT [Acinetobacter rathckeae]MBF7689143.1 zinc transporter ZupT [Acinetobacter rathckeae]MBF7696730.1 zinc transporter ZupT [Acinetobacter rathckeae]
MVDHNVFIAFMLTIAASFATVIGGIIVCFFKQPSARLLSFGLAFAAGAMVYVSLTEILNKSISSFSSVYSENIGYSFATFAFLGGMVLVLILDRLVPNPHDTLEKNTASEMNHQQIMRTGLLTMFAITAHNLPEGLATFFATLDSPIVGAPLAIAIAIHNIPEGIAIALPVYIATHNKWYAVGASLLSGLAEPFGAAVGYLFLAPYLNDIVYGIVFGLISGVMVYLALDELLPTAKKYAKGHETVYGLVVGMSALALSLVAFKFA